MNANLYAQLSGRFMIDPGKTFLDIPGGESITYGQMDTWSARIAATLIDLGAMPGDRVVVQVPKSINAVALYLACLRTGLVYVPLNTNYTHHEVQYFLNDAQPAMFVHGDPTPAAFTPSITAESLFARAEHDQPLEPIHANDPDDLAAMLYTSGTTGRSKGAMLTHANLASNALALHEIWGFRPGDVLLHVLPIFHVHGLFVALHTAMLNASSVVFLERFDVDQVIANMSHATVMMGVPTHYARLLADPRIDGELCSNMRLFTSGSAPMTEALHQAFTTRTGLRILERYGMTEAGMITSNPYDGERIPGTVGFALPGVELRVCDSDGHVCEPGVTGVVELRGPNLFAGYWQMPQRSEAEHKPDGFFITGDIGSMDVAGRLTLEGRSSDMVISGGYNVYPKEIEMVVDAVDGVEESAVVGVQHQDLGQVPICVVVAQSESREHLDQLEIAIKAAVSERLARFKRPRSIHFVDQLPRNAMGKVQKTDLRGLFNTDGSTHNAD